MKLIRLPNGILLENIDSSRFCSFSHFSSILSFCLPYLLKPLSYPLFTSETAMVAAMTSMASRFRIKAKVDLCYLAVMFCAFLVPSFAELQRFEHPIKSDGSLSFLVIGDWGRKGFYNQSEVAFQVQLLHYHYLPSNINIALLIYFL